MKTKSKRSRSDLSERLSKAVEASYMEPCPRAAQDAVVEIEITHGRVEYRVRCIDGGCFCGPYMPSLAEAVRRWNLWCEAVEAVECELENEND